MPEEASTYALPERWRTQWHIRRYGFHGLSLQWAAEQVPVERLIVCHLGGGCSVSAVRDGRSLDTTMGFSPLEGVPMATRSGSVDAAAILYLLRSGAATLAELDEALERESGLLGLSGVSGSVEELERAAEPAAARRSSSTAIASPARSARSRSRSAVSTPSSSRAAWGRARRSCAHACASAWACSESSSTSRSTTLGRFRRARRKRIGGAGGGRAGARGRGGRARGAAPLGLVGPPALHELAVAVVAGAEREHLEVGVGAGLERAHHLGRDADRIARPELDDLVVELDAAGAGEHDVDLLGVLVLVPEGLALAGLEAERLTPVSSDARSSFAKRASWISPSPNLAPESSISVSFLSV